LNLLCSYTQCRYSETVRVDILQFGRNCGRHIEDSVCRVTNCTHFLLTLICYSHMVLLACWVSTFSHILLPVKVHANSCAVIERKIKWKSLCFFCYSQFLLLWPPWYTHWCLEARGTFQTQNNSTPKLLQTN